MGVYIPSEFKQRIKSVMVKFYVYLNGEFIARVEYPSEYTTDQVKHILLAEGWNNRIEVI